MPRSIAIVAHKYKLGEEPSDTAFWRNRSPEERLLEVERLRRMWCEQFGDPDAPMVRAISKRTLS